AQLAGMPPKPRVIQPRRRFSMIDLLRNQLDLGGGRRDPDPAAPREDAALPHGLDHRRGPRRPPPSLPRNRIAPAKPALGGRYSDGARRGFQCPARAGSGYWRAQGLNP